MHVCLLDQEIKLPENNSTIFFLLKNTVSFGDLNTVSLSGSAMRGASNELGPVGTLQME